jgi:peptidoglycan/LPS O-acetylase OafA/YrhL
VSALSQNSSNERTIPSLDGLRAFSVLFVILGHTRSTFLDGLPFLRPFRDGELGVNVFFVISGFLITQILLREADSYGHVSVGRFYIRRAFRIFPPFYAFLAVVSCLRIAHVYSFEWRSLFSAATYIWNYNLHTAGWILAHTWSLSLEEQFYLVWPACIVMFSRRACLRISQAAVVLSPISRVGTYFLFPAWRGHMNMMLHTHIDTIMVGCFIAIAWNLHLFPRVFQSLTRPYWLIPISGYLFIAGPYLGRRYAGTFGLPVGITLTSLCCGAILVYVVRAPESVLGRILNKRWIKHLGVISYSLYLWQQMFTGPCTIPFPLNVLFILLCAEASYWLVEKPFNRLRDKVTGTVRGRRKTERTVEDGVGYEPVFNSHE